MRGEGGFGSFGVVRLLRFRTYLGVVFTYADKNAQEQSDSTVFYPMPRSLFVTGGFLLRVMVCVWASLNLAQTEAKLTVLTNSPEILTFPTYYYTRIRALTVEFAMERYTAAS